MNTTHPLISAESRSRLAGHQVIAAVSGGKDSTAMCLLLVEQGVEYSRVFADTGWEAPETYEYLEKLRAVLGPIAVVRNEKLWDGAARELADIANRPLTDAGGLRVMDRPKRCLRQQPATAAKEQTIRTCKVCPHRGFPIASMPAVDGVITCPGHGLRWSAETGELVRTLGPVRADGLRVLAPPQTGPKYDAAGNWLGFGNPRCPPRATGASEVPHA